MNTYKVTYDQMKPVMIEADTPNQAIRYAKEFLLSYGYELSGKPTVEQMIEFNPEV